MKKRKVIKHHKGKKASRVSRVGTDRLMWGLDPNFILILGGGFLVVVLGMMILNQ